MDYRAFFHSLFLLCFYFSPVVQVLHSEPLMMKIQSSSLEMCHILYRLLQSSPSNSSMSAVQVCRMFKFGLFDSFFFK